MMTIRVAVCSDSLTWMILLDFGARYINSRESALLFVLVLGEAVPAMVKIEEINPSVKRNDDQMAGMH